jgi:hypothetical protein
MTEQADGSNALFAILDQEIDKVVAKNKEFYDKTYEKPEKSNRSSSRRRKGSARKPRSNKYEVQADEKKEGKRDVSTPKINELSTLKNIYAPDLNAAPKRPSKKGKRRKNKIIQFSNEIAYTPKVNKESTSEREELTDATNNVNKVNPIKAMIMDDLENEVALPEAKTQDQKNDDFDYALEPQKKKEVDESNKLKELIKENMENMKKRVDIGENVILEEEEKSVEIESGVELNANLPIAQLIDGELANVENPKNTKKNKEEQQKLRELKEETTKIKLKEGKLRDNAIGGVFTNSLAAKAKLMANNTIQNNDMKDNEIKDNKVNNDSVKDDVEKNESDKELVQVKEDMEKEKKSDMIMERYAKAKAVEDCDTKELIEVNNKQEECEIEKDSQVDDWDKINEQRDKERKQAAVITDVNKLTYENAWSYLKSQDLSELLPLIVRETKTQQSFFQKLMCCFATRNELDESLKKERDTILALMKLKMSCDFHSLMLERIFNLISMYAPETETKDWVLIGFQGSNPETDIRGTGMFGVLQVHFFAENFSELIKKYFLLSIDEVQKFPLVVLMFNHTAFTTEALREGRLTLLCNKAKSVIQVMNLFYAATFSRLIERWEKDKLTIVDWDKVSKENIKYCKDNPMKIIEEFNKLTEA